MSIINGNSLEGAGYEIAKSLRFRSSASSYLSRTPSVTGNRNTWTFSVNGKRGSLGLGFLLCAYQDANNFDYLYFTSNNTLIYWQRYAGTDYQVQTTAVYRDPSAHMHILLNVDQNAVASERVKMIINGVRQSVTGTGSGIGTLINVASQVHYIARSNAGEYFDGYLSEINFIDGQALSPYSFGEFSSETAQWIPKKYTGAYGTNGFYLPFNDGSNLTNLCLDRSGNTNNWTASGISLTAGATYDWMDDTPTNNFAVLNPVMAGVSSTGTISDGGLTESFGVGSVAGSQISTFALQNGKPYYEASISSLSIGSVSNGVQTFGFRSVSNSATKLEYGWITDGSVMRHSLRYVLAGVQQARVNIDTTPPVGTDVLAIALDVDAGVATAYKNGVQTAQITGISASVVDWSPAVFRDGTDNGGVWRFNFGQRPFAYAPPTGFKSLCTKNMLAPVIANPKKHFDVGLYAGDGTSSRVLSLAQFDPDLSWIKQRSGTANHMLNDRVRGNDKALISNLTNAESAYTGYFSFGAQGSNQLSVSYSGSGGPDYGYNQSGNTYAAWLWKANGAPVANNAGSIQSQVSANTTAGFSIVTYTGTGANATVGHGLGVAPKMVIVKARVATTTSDAWNVGHSSLTGGFGDFLELNSTGARVTAANRWNSTNPTSLVFSIGPVLSDSAKSFVAYCFAEVPGFSKIDKYVGNGSADGPFVWCGFRPRFVMIKRTDASGYSWYIWDSARETYNQMNNSLYANLSNAENLPSIYIDFISNGFKVRSSSSDVNASGGTYIFMAFAEAPFQYANAR